MIDNSKYAELIRLIDRYNDAIESEREYYSREMNRHPADFVRISAESNLRDDLARGECLSALRKEFPNIVFSIRDVELLSNYYGRKVYNKGIINRTELDIIYSKRGGQSVSKFQVEEMNAAIDKQPELEKQYTDAYTCFFEICEKLNNPELLENPEFDFEGDIFSKMYEQGFCLRPQNSILKKYYEAYKSRRDVENSNKTLAEENSNLLEQVEQVTQDNRKLSRDNETLENSNNELKQKNSRLQSMLKKTLEFCNYVKESRFGRFFFRKKIKELPEPQSDEEER